MTSNREVVKSKILGLLIVTLCAWFQLAFSAELLPKQIRIIVPFPPGGSNDIVARALAQELSPRLQRSIVVENRPGAGGSLGAAIAAHSDPDAGTLLLISSSFTMNPSVMKLNYDPEKSFAPVAMLGMGSSVIAVSKKLPINSIGELVDYSKKNPEAINFGSAGIASFQHFAIELIKLKTTANFSVIQYKGGGPALIDLAAGHIQASLGSLVQMQSFLRSGKIKLLAVAGPKRLPLIPNIPTLRESGIEVDAVNWWGLLAPAGTSTELLDLIHQATNASLTTSNIQNRFTNEGAEIAPMSRSDFEKFLTEETAKWAKVAKQTNIKQE